MNPQIVLDILENHNVDPISTALEKHLAFHKIKNAEIILPGNAAVSGS